MDVHNIWLFCNHSSANLSFKKLCLVTQEQLSKQMKLQKKIDLQKNFLTCNLLKGEKAFKTLTFYRGMTSQLSLLKKAPGCYHCTCYKTHEPINMKLKYMTQLLFPAL